MKLYKIICLAMAFALTAATPVCAQPVTDANKPLHTVKAKAVQAKDIVVTGEIPSFTGADKKDFSDEINGIAAQFYDDTLAKAAGMKKVEEIRFSYETFQSDDYFSVVMHGMINPGDNGTDDVRTIVLGRNHYVRYPTLSHILGENGNKIANAFILAEIRKHPRDYFTADMAERFRSVTSSTAFYMNDNNDLVVIFSKNEIAPGDTGTPAFTLPMNQFLHFTLKEEQFIQKDGAAMLPLRSMAERLGYTVTWDAVTRLATVSRGTVSHSVGVGVKTCEGKPLSHETEVFYDILHVPADFFEIACGLFSHVELNDKISFSMLFDPATGATLASGEIISAAADTITIQTADGQKLSFDTADADKSRCFGLTPGADVNIYFLGEIDGEDTTGATVVSMTQ